jgi:acetylornithine deacetylase/succinyl-diaminopimelate desuccinylase family protein
MKPSLLSQIQDALKPHRSAIVQFTSDLVAIPSENPSRKNYAACVQRIRKELDTLGLDYVTYDAPPHANEPRTNILSFVGAGERTVYIHGHYDVVPAQSPGQYSPKIEDGFLYGRGSTDMKSGLAAMTYAAFALKKLGLPAHGRIGLCFVPDEESGGQGGASYLDQIGVLGKGGIAMINAEPTSGVVWNASRGALTLNVTVRGKVAHVGLQHQGVNAFEGMLKVATALQRLKAQVEPRTTKYHIEPPESAHSILMLGGRVEGGINYNAVPEFCSFTVERRINPEEDFETERKQVYAVLESCKREGINLDVEVLQECSSSGISEDHEVARTLASSIEDVTGKRAVFEMCPGTAETRWYAKHGIPSFGYGPGLLELAHGPNERVEIESIYQHAAIQALTTTRLLE